MLTAPGRISFGDKRLERDLQNEDVLSSKFARHYNLDNHDRLKSDLSWFNRKKRPVKFPMSTRKTKAATNGQAKTARAKKPSKAKKTSATLPPFKGSVTHLIHRAEQCAGNIFASEAPNGVLTPRQFAILEAVSENPGISQTGLVDRTGIDRSTLADIVRRMLDKDLLQRQRTAEDARAYAVKLTRKGTNTLKKMRPRADAVDKQLMDAIPKEHRDAFLAVLAQMVSTLTESDDEQPN